MVDFAFLKKDDVTQKGLRLGRVDAYRQDQCRVKDLSSNQFTLHIAVLVCVVRTKPCMFLSMLSLTKVSLLISSGESGISASRAESGKTCCH